MASRSSHASAIQELSRLVNFYFSASVVPVGIALNVATALIFGSKSMSQKTNMSLLYTSLAVFDILALFNSILFIQLLPSVGVNLVNLSEVMCKLIILWRRTVIQAPSWYLVLITLDRFRSVYYPNKYKFLEKKRTLFGITVGIFPSLMLINSVHLDFSLRFRQTNESIVLNGTRIYRQSISYSCTSMSAAIMLITDILVVMMRSYVPFTLMLILNVALTRKFLKSKQKLLTTSSNSSKELNSNLKREYYFTFTVITMNLTFFVLYTPWSGWYLVNRVFQFNPASLSPTTNAALNLAQSVTFSIAYCNNLSSFFNNLIFNFIFRKNVLRIIGIKQIVPINQNSCKSFNSHTRNTRNTANTNQ
jgi:hypothetical protein